VAGSAGEGGGGSPLRVAVVGAGMAGIATVVRLRQAGITDVVVYEKADRVGGTWRENTYPGIACDVPSHLYSYSFAPNPEWSHTFAAGAEIQAYLERVVEDFDVAPHLRLGIEVTGLVWEDPGWRVETAGGAVDRADVVVAATGVLHHPHVADLPGLDRFAGPAFHSARWDHGVELDGARVGVVGTGSSAVQITSALAGRSEELRLFQRTAQWVLQVPNRAIADEERARFRSEPAAMSALRSELGRAFDSGFANAVVDAESPEAALLEEACRDNLEQHVADPELRERLRPSYRAACKRLILSPDFYDAVQRPGVQVVTSAIEEVEPGGIRTADGKLHELDVLVLATGFRVDRFLRPIAVTGRDGLTLDEAWAARPSAYLSVSVPGFPNLFLLNGPNGPIGNFSLIDVAELQLGYLLQLLEPVRRGEATAVCATAEAAERFEAERVEAAGRTIWMTGCRSWYLDDRGVPAAWPWPVSRFRQVMQAPELGDYGLVP
jgi:cation diffusion facilitator CzcD-associated flavoprotein CzcO